MFQPGYVAQGQSPLIPGVESIERGSDLNGTVGIENRLDGIVGFE